MRTVFVIVRTKGRRTLQWGLGYATIEEAKVVADQERRKPDNAGWEIKIEKREVAA